MDKIDKIILAELANNCRQPLSKIGKTIRKSPQFVKYRLENLKEKTIKNIPIIIDFYSLGYQEVTALIKFDIIDPISEKIVIDHLFKMTETYKLVYLNGNYDLLVSFVVKNLSEIPRIKENLETFAKTNIIFLTNYSAKILSHNYLSEKYSEKKIILGSKEQQFMNNQIKPVIKELQRNPFASLLEISQNLKTSYDKVSYAIKNSTLFLGNTLLISEQEIQRSIIFFKIKNKQALDSYCKFDKNIVEINYLIGNYDSYIIVESLENIKQLAKKIIFDLKEAITSYTILDANQFYKYGWYGL